MDNELTKSEPAEIQISQDAPPMVQIAQMMQSGLKVDVEQMKGLMEISERYEANEARKAFAADFTQVQAKVAAVVKNKKNPQTNSMYAGLDNVLEMVRPIYTKYGFSVIFHEGKAEIDNYIRMCADVLHRAGHSEKYHADLPLDETGIKGSVNKTKMHGKGSSFSYGRRYMMCLIWNIPTQDDDGNGAGGNKHTPRIPEITAEERNIISQICDKLPPASQGLILNTNRITAILLEKSRPHLTQAYITEISEYLMNTFTDADLYCKDTRTDFGKNNDLNPDPNETEGFFSQE